MNYWIFKTEPDAYSIDDLKKDNIEHWDGIRNYQVRNFIRDDMKVGDKVFIYHSRVKEPGIVGLAEIVKEGYPDHFAWDPDHKYFDSKSSSDNPRWFMVDIKFVEKYAKTYTLEEMKVAKELSEARIVQRGNRLSITPLNKTEFNFILKQVR